eukprot:COSAG01_NODE_1479_length_10161_cov_138.934109_10_plen_210_part_00
MVESVQDSSAAIAQLKMQLGVSTSAHLPPLWGLEGRRRELRRSVEDTAELADAYDGLKIQAEALATELDTLRKAPSPERGPAAQHHPGNGAASGVLDLVGDDGEDVAGDGGTLDRPPAPPPTIVNAATAAAAVATLEFGTRAGPKQLRSIIDGLEQGVQASSAQLQLLRCVSAASSPESWHRQDTPCARTHLCTPQNAEGSSTWKLGKL